jgi:hypothetical protein
MSALDAMVSIPALWEEFRSFASGTTTARITMTTSLSWGGVGRLIHGTMGTLICISQRVLSQQPFYVARAT